SISISPKFESLKVGETGEIGVSANYGDGSQNEVEKGITWQTSDPAIAEVLEGNKLQAIQVGKLTITPTMGNLNSTPIEIEVKGVSSDDINQLIEGCEGLHKQGHYLAAIRCLNQLLIPTLSSEQKRPIEEAINKAETACDAVKRYGRSCE